MGLGMDIVKRPTKERPAQHDNLHSATSCGCMKKCCWYQWWHKRNDGTKILLGICICPECPCNSPRFAVLRKV